MTTEPQTTEFALALRSWRTRERISQREAALRLNRPYSTYRQWEYGLRVPHGAELYLQIINNTQGKDQQ